MNKEEDKDFLLVQEWQNTKNPQILKLIFDRNISMIRQISKRYKYDNTFLTKEDLMSEGLFGLLFAANKFKINKNVKFSTYAYHWIRGRISRINENVHKIEKESLSNNNNTNDSEEYTWEDFIPEKYDFNQETKHLNMAIALLNEKEKTIIKLRYLNNSKMTIEKIANKINISKERTRQINNEAIKKLRSYLQALI